jgi:hypothetical protein
MNELLKQFSEKLALDLKAKFSSQQIAEFIKQAKASGDDRSFEVVMSTADEDRQGDSLDQANWDLKYYDMNPVVLWAHNYSSFPIGVIEDIKTVGDKTVATGKFAPKGVNPEADIACELYQEKILRAVSPGYIQNDDGTRELLEVSFCPVPAGRYALTLRQVGRMGVSTRDLVTKGFFYETKGAVPYSDHGEADPDESWDGPAEVKACGDDLKKLKAICAWFDSEDPDVKSSYKLPHHRASDLKAVWKGVSAAGNAISGARGGVNIPEKDLAAVKAHLAKHYKAFGKEPPWEKKSKSPQVGDTCQLDDGTPGVLAEDPKSPGELRCVPERDKSQKTETDMNNELTKTLKEEHERHAKAIGKAIDEFETKATADEEGSEEGKAHKEDGDNSEYEKAIDEFKDAIDGEHDEHLKKCMKAIDDNYETMGRKPNEKSIDEFKSEMKSEHLKHVKAFHKAIDEFKSDHADADGKDEREQAFSKCEKAMTDELERHEKAHMELCEKEAERMGEGEDDGKSEEEKAIAELARKAGRAISAKNKEKLKAILEKMESHHNDVTAAIKELMGSEDGDGGEEHKPDEKGGAPNSRSSTSGASELETYLLTQRLVRQVKTAAEGALRQINEKLKDARNGR